GLPQVNLRKQFVIDMISTIAEFQRAGHEIVLMMDANEPSGSGTAADVISLACGLRDAHTLSMTATAPPTTQQRGSEKIDFVLVSPRTALAIRAASILPLHDGYLSDHRALVVDFDASILFSASTFEIVVPKSRQLTSTNPVAVQAYVKHMLEHIDYHRIEDCIARLVELSVAGSWGQDEVLEWERIDNSLAQARQAAESNCPTKRPGKHPWSPDFDLAGKKVLYWKLQMREFTARAKNDTTRDALAAALGFEDDKKQPKTREEVYQLLRDARRNMRKVKSQASELREDHLAQTANLRRHYTIPQKRQR
ncbi:hypothetical protein, partial [Janthinobacterium sp.]|uniref:hypothetical protein n=1 Tax=Janthinobacterium sp. TaxID=1871054 RepID=UPI00293D2F63